MEAPSPQNGDAERKRPLGASTLGSSTDPSEPPAKQAKMSARARSALAAEVASLGSSSGDTATQPACGEDDEQTQQFKLRAMSLRFQELKRQLSSYENKLRAEEEKHHVHDATIATVTGCWDQLRCDLEVILAKLAPSEIQEGDSRKELKRSKTFLNALLSSPSPPPSESLEASIRESVRQRMDYTHKIIEKVVTAIEAQREKSARVAEMLRDEATKANANLAAELTRDNEELRALNTKLQESLDAFQVKYRKATTEAAALREENTRLEQQLAKLQAEYDQKTIDLELAERRVDKLQSGESLRPPRQEKPKVAAPAPAPAAAPVVAEPKNADDAAAAAGMSEADKLRLEETEQELLEARTLAEHRMTEIAQLREEKIALGMQISKLQSDMSTAMYADDKVAKSRLYGVLKGQCAVLQSEVDASRHQIESMRAQLGMLESRDELNKIREMDNARMLALDRDLREANERAQRQKKERDAYAYRFQQKSLEQPSPATLEEYKKIMAAQEKELKRLRPEYEKLKAEMEKGMKRSDGEAALLAEIDVLSKSFEENSDQIARLTRQLAEREDMNVSFMKERKQNETVQAQLRQEKEVLVEKISKLEEKISLQQTMLAQLEGKAKTAADALSRANEEARLLSQSSELSKRAAREAGAMMAEYKSQAEQLNVNIQDMRKQLDELTRSLESALNQNSRLHEEHAIALKKAERLSDRMRGANLDIGLTRELEDAKRKLLCSVCKERNKDTVISKCFHVFCRACIKRNLEIRLRKCPGCQKPFGEGDVHSIFLNFE